MIQLSKADIGKKFRTRKGEVLEMFFWRDSLRYPALMSNEESYTDKGNYLASGKEDPLDIISRCEESAPDPQEKPAKRIVITVLEKGISTDVEGMSVLEAFGALNHVVRTFIEDKP